MNNVRLAQIQENLNDWYEQLGGKEKAFNRAPEEEKTRIRQQIRDVKKDIQQVEADYLQCLKQESVELTFEEADAQAVLDVVAKEVTRIESKASEYPDELLRQVRAIRAILEKSGTSATLKIKPVISLVPPGIGLTIEGELDTENFLRKNFPTFVRLVEGSKKKVTLSGRDELLEPDWRVKILVAVFEEPGALNYRVTDNILSEIRLKTDDYEDVKIVPLDKHITVREGKEVARQIGQEEKADIVIWGWYYTTRERAQVSVNFELLKKPDGLPKLGEEARGQLRTMEVEALERIEIQIDLAQEITYLSLVTLGISCHAANDWDGTIHRLTSALKSVKVLPKALDPATIYFFRATAHLFKGENEQALADCKKAIELNPNLAEAYVNQGVALSATNDVEREIASYDKALKSKPGLHQAWYNRGIALSSRGKFDEAIASYNKAIEIEPNKAEAWLARGLSLRNLGLLKEAIDSYDKAISIRPDLYEAWYNRGIALRSSGETEKAIRSFKEAINHNKKYAKAFYNIACAHALLDEPKPALENLRRSIELECEKYLNKARTDPDFDKINTNPDWQTLIPQKI